MMSPPSPHFAAIDSCSRRRLLIALRFDASCFEEAHCISQISPCLLLRVPGSMSRLQCRGGAVLFIAVPPSGAASCLVSKMPSSRELDVECLSLTAR